MKIYLVGGAVRDQALGLPVSERDWVVVGATPADLLQQGYQQVGRDFPVFLHPVTREEYALARTERKLAPGYYGFACDSNPHVSLEEDLLRRDLTINAMAQDEQGVLIDPYHGMRDLHAKCLRHVSTAFLDDPLRVLRVARFYARFYHLGFTIAEETQALLIRMVRSGELSALVPERIWQEWQASLGTNSPQEFIRSLRAIGALRVIVPELDGLFGIPNAPDAGHFIDAGMQALKNLARVSHSSSDPMVRFAVLLLELGKQETPMAQWPMHGVFSERSVVMIKALCQRLRIANPFRDLACLCAALQTKIQPYVQRTAAEVVTLFEQADAFRRPARFEQVLTVLQAQNPQRFASLTIPHWLRLLQLVRAVRVTDLTDSQDGAVIKQVLYKQRVSQVQHQLTEWEAHEK